MRVIRNTFLFSELDNERDIIDLLIVLIFTKLAVQTVGPGVWCLQCSVHSAVCSIFCANFKLDQSSTFQFKQGESNSTKSIKASKPSFFLLPWFVRIEANELVILTIIDESFLSRAQSFSQRGTSPPPVILCGLFKLEGSNGVQKLPGKLVGYYYYYYVVVIVCKMTRHSSSSQSQVWLPLCFAGLGLAAPAERDPPRFCRISAAQLNQCSVRDAEYFLC